jgi:hypothetical protein
VLLVLSEIDNLHVLKAFLLFTLDGNARHVFPVYELNCSRNLCAMELVSGLVG